MSRRELRHKPLDIEILVSDVSKQEESANAAIDDSKYVANVYKRGEWPIRSEWFCLTDEFSDRLLMCKELGIGINGELAHFLAREVSKAQASIKKDDQGNVEHFKDAAIYVLHRSGCRAYVTHDYFSKKYGHSRTYITGQIQLLKKWGFIVNYGQGWVEFDHRLVWRGKLKFLAGYAPAQEIAEDLVETHKQANDFYREWKRAKAEERKEEAR